MSENTKPASVTSTGGFNQKVAFGRATMRIVTQSASYATAKPKKSTCADCARPSSRLAIHVATPGGKAVTLCMGCLRRYLADERRQAARAAFVALFRPVPSGTGGAPVIVVLAVSTAKRRAV